MADEKFEVSDKAIQAFKSASERTMGYLYAGMLPVLIITIENPATVKSFVNSTGGLFAAIICVSLGIGIFTIYLKILGELLIYPLQHLLHWIADRLSGLQGVDQTSVIGLLIALGVKWNAARSVYWSVRLGFCTRDEQSMLEVEHGELHVLYLTSVICFSAHFLMPYAFDHQPSPAYLLIAIISFFAALIADTRQHSEECEALKRRLPELKQFLKAKCII